MSLLGLPSDFAGETQYFAVIGFDTLEHYGSPVTFQLFRLFRPFEEWNGCSASNPMALPLPTDLLLQVLDFCNATLPWSFNIPTRVCAQWGGFTQS